MLAGSGAASALVSGLRWSVATAAATRVGVAGGALAAAFAVGAAGGTLALLPPDTTGDGGSVAVGEGVSVAVG